MARIFRKNKAGLATIAIVAVLVVAVVIAAAAGYYFLSQPPANPSDGTPTPTPPEGTATPNPTGSPNIGEASSLKYSVTVTENGAQAGAYTFWGKNAGTNDFSMRIEYTDDEGDGTYIFNGAQKKAWVYAGGEWTDISEYFNMQWDIWNNVWSGYTTSLNAWAGTGDYTYSAEGTTVRIYDISVNPTLEDSLFIH
jgi:hypothetical protein